MNLTKTEIKALQKSANYLFEYPKDMYFVFDIIKDSCIGNKHYLFLCKTQEDVVECFRNHSKNIVNYDFHKICYGKFTENGFLLSKISQSKIDDHCYQEYQF